MIDKALFWNIKSINTQNAFGRLTNLHRRQKYSFIALMDPFRDPSELDQYKRGLGFDNALVNCSGKIWIFWNDGWAGTVIRDAPQQITIKFNMYNKDFYIASVYARCSGG